MLHAMSADQLCLSDLTRASHHPGDECERDRDDQPGFIDERRRQAQDLCLVDPQVKGGKEHDQHQQPQGGGHAPEDCFQGDVAADDRPARWQAKKDVAASVYVEGVEWNDQERHTQRDPQQSAPSLGMGMVLARRRILDRDHPQEDDEVQRVTGQCGCCRDGNRPRGPGNRVQHG